MDDNSRCRSISPCGFRIINNPLELHGIVGKDPFNPSVDFTEKAIAGSNEPGPNGLIRFSVSVTEILIEQEIVPRQSTITATQRFITDCLDFR